MKRRFIILISLLLAFIMCLCACGVKPGQSGSSSQQASSGESGPKKTEAPANTPKPEKPKPILMHEINMNKYREATSWIDYFYEGGRLVSSANIIDRLTSSYDEQGRCITVKAADGTVVAETRYDEQGNIVYYMPRNSTTFMLKDHQGNEIFRSGQNGGMAEDYEYDELGRVVYSRFHTEKLGNIEISFTYEYSPDGLHLDVTRYCNGTINGSMGATYDHQYNLFFEIDYDGKGHIIREVDHSLKNGLITTWTYDDEGRMVERVTDNGGSITTQTWNYDSSGTLVSYVNDEPLCEWTYTYTRSSDGKLLETHTKTVTSDGTVTEWLSQVNEYNSHGDIARRFYYSSYAEDLSDWTSAVYFLYDYDDIDPHIDSSYLKDAPER